MESKQAILKATMKDKAQNVLTELGQNALSSGYWNNGLGQMGIYVNEAGLHALAGSKNALAFTRDVTHAYRIKAADADGSLEAIENAFLANESIDVEVYLNISEVEYDIDNTLYKPSPGMSAQAQTILDDIAKQNFAKGIKNLENGFSSKPAIRANIDRLAFYALIERDDIRAIRLTNYQDSRPLQKASAFGSDILAALTAVNNNTVVGVNNPFIVNMSLGGGLYSSQSSCLSITSINNTVTNLISRGVPVIAATGNDFNKSNIAWPACIPGIIKVSAVKNDSTGTTLSSFANIASQPLFPQGPFLLAPGGGDSTNVRSADRTSTTATKLMQGTSQAAPHVAGLYAAIKAANPGGISVADVTAWVVTTGSIAVTVFT